MKYSLAPFILAACGLHLAGAPSPRLQASDPRGPVVNAGMTVRTNADGVQTVGYRFRPAAPQAALKASWIWLDAAANAGQGAQTTALAAWFRKEVDLSDAPQSVQARVSADRVYRLWINGKLVSRGPADPGNDIDPRFGWSHRWLYDCRDLTRFFHKGKNVIAAEVFSAEQPNYSLGKAGFLFEAEVRSAKSRITVATGPDWRATVAAAFSFAGEEKDPYLRYDARREPEGWRLPGFDDSKWPAAAPVESVWGTLAASEVPPRMEAIYPAAGISRASDGVTLPAKPGGVVKLAGDGKFSVDYDRVLSAYASVRVHGPAGAEILIEPNELKQPGFRRKTGVILRDGVTLYEFPTMDSFSTLNIEVRNASGPVVFEDIRASFISYPVAYRGSFETSDAELNRLWKSFRWATQICMQTHHLDSPNHQEPISDPGDYLIEAAENYYAFGEPWLARQDLRKFGLILKNSGYLNFHTSYSLLWLQMLVDYYDYTGDAALVRELAPIAHGLLDKFGTWRGRNGLISESPSYMFLDWVKINGIPCHHPPAVIGQGYMTAFYYRSLADGMRLAALTGDTSRAARYKELRSATAAAFERELWNADKGLYRDGKPFQTSVKPDEWLPADTEMETFSPHVNTLAVLYDLAPKARQRAILGRVMRGEPLPQEPLNVQPYFMHFVYDALAHAGLFERYAVAQMHKLQINPDSGTVREMWTDGDYSHGWGGTPLIQMSSRILGVTPATPGFAKIAIRPQPCGLKFARGVVPTPHGNVDVDWRREGAQFTLKVTVPSGTTAHIVLPVAGTQVSVDGVALKAAKPGAAIPVVAGAHTLTVTGIS
jgi:alpha-L-rhamnosidase